jgi:uncharacterized ferredoxin-like protein
MLYSLADMIPLEIQCLSVKTSREAEDAGLLNIAGMMAVAARTAPKTRGVDEIVTAVLTGEGKDRIADEMEQLYKDKQNPLAFFSRDAGNLRTSPVLVLIGVKGTMPKGPENPLNCGACGYETCTEFIAVEKRLGEDFTGPLCVWHAVDLGVAMGSAVKIASELNADNRIMYSVGVAAKALRIIDADVIVGIPLSAEGKNIFFDRS